jgi:hypothetical protein
MADGKDEIKAPNPAVVEKAHLKQDSGDELNQREAAALEAQAAIDNQRGYREVDWKGQKHFQSLITGHTTSGPNAEYDMIQHHAGLHHAGIVDPRA